MLVTRIRSTGIIRLFVQSVLGLETEEPPITPEASAAPVPESPAAKAVPINVTPSGLEGLKLYEREIATCRRELPRLLVEGHAWRHALVKGDEVLSLWDTQGDAIQAGRARFGLDPIFVKTIDPRDPERWSLLDAWLEAQCRP